MKKRIKKRDFIKKLPVATGLYVFLICSYLFSASPQLTIVSDKKELGKGETLKINAELSWKQSENREEGIRILKVSPPSCPLLELVDSRQETSSRLTGDGVFAAKSMEYVFRAEKKGEASLEPLVIEYINVPVGIPSVPEEDREIIKSDSIDIKVTAAAVSLIKKISNLLIRIVLLTVISALIYTLIRLYKRSAEKKHHAGYDTQDEMEFLERLKNLNKHIIEGDISRYYESAYNALNIYIRKKFGISKLTGDSEAHIQLPEQLESLSSEWRVMEEKVRFSGYRPERNELEKLTRETERYFRSLIPEGDPEELLKTVK